MRWKGVSTGSAGTLCPADGLVGDLLTMGPAPGGVSHPGLSLGYRELLVLLEAFSFPVVRCSTQPGRSSWAFCWNREMFRDPEQVTSGLTL